MLDRFCRAKELYRPIVDLISNANVSHGSIAAEYVLYLWKEQSESIEHKWVHEFLCAKDCCKEEPVLYSVQHKITDARNSYWTSIIRPVTIRLLEIINKSGLEESAICLCDWREYHFAKSKTVYEEFIDLNSIIKRQFAARK